MNEKLDFVLQRLDGELLSKLWLFYRKSFKSDKECLDFIFSAVQQEPPYSEIDLTERFAEAFDDMDSFEQKDQVFIPRRMLNCVERMVSAARDMEQIRKGKDAFKIVLLVSCVETLQMLKDKKGKKKSSKGKILYDFFVTNTSEKDKEYIRKHFARGMQGVYPDEDSFLQFVHVLNEYRNAAAHEGEYWEGIFNNYKDCEALSVIVKVQLDGDASKTQHIFETTISYCDFDEIFVRTCISFIKSYVASQQKNVSTDA